MHVENLLFFYTISKLIRNTFAISGYYSLVSSLPKLSCRLLVYIINNNMDSQEVFKCTGAKISMSAQLIQMGEI